METDNYYYVLRLDEITDADATEEHRQEIISQRQSDLYNEVLQGWKDEAEWVLKDKVWDKVTFDNLFTTTVESTETTETTESSTTDNAVLFPTPGIPISTILSFFIAARFLLLFFLPQCMYTSVFRYVCTSQLLIHIFF